MKNNFKRILSLILITSFGFISACNNNNSNNNESSSTDSSQESYEEFIVDNDSLNIWLDRYEECDIKLAKGDINKLTITSNDESVVSVEKQRLIAQGKGETTVTISNGKDKVNITVKVRQSGVKPVFAFNSLEAYIGYDYELPQEISLNGNTFKTTIKYEVTIEDESIVKYENNKLTGLVKGTTKATVSSLYKGLTITKEYTLEVKDLLYISFSSDEINLHNVTTKLGKQELDAIVYEKGEAKADYEIIYEITSGNDVIKIEDGVVFALKEGNATIKASFTKDNKTYTSSINVVVSANYIDTKFINTAEVPITFEETNETIAGRSGGIYKYQANKDVDGNTCWSNHICEQNNTKSIIDLYKEGKRYFAYDLYYQSNQNLMIGSGSLTSWISVGDYFRKDYIKIIKDGEVTNRLEKNCWITVVYDLKALWEKNMGLSSYFFFFVNDGTTTQYLMNAKYYLDDTFIPDENLKYEDNDTYYQATNDEFDVMIPISKYYSMETGQPSIVVNENEVPTYKKANETIGGRNSAYKYETKINSSLKNSLIVASSMNDSYDESMYRMSKMGNYYAFDIYPTTDSTLTFALNNGSTSASVTVDKTNVSEFENWLIVLKDGKRQNTIKKNEWQTIVYAFNDAYDDNQYSASLTFSANNENSLVYIDNCRYYKDNSFIPNEYEEEYIRPIVPENSLSSKISVERITSGDFKGSYKYTNKTSGEYEGDNQNWGESGIRFNGVTTKDDQTAEFFTNGYRYIKYEMYLAENVSSISLRVSADRNLTQYWMHDIKVNSSIDNESIYIFNSDETLAKSLERETWYTVYIPVKYSSTDCGNTYITMYTNGGSEQKPAVAYIRYISYEDEMNTLFVRNDGAYADNVELEYIKDEGDFKNSYKYTNKTSGEYEGNNQNWGESGVHFSKVTAKDDSESGAFFKDGYKWIKTDVYFDENVKSFTIRVTGDQNMTNYWEKDIKVNSPLNGRNVYLVDNHGNRTNYLKANSWYTLYIPFEYTSPDTGWTMVSLYTNGGSISSPSIMYLKDISYLKEANIPEAEIDDILARTDYKDEVSIEKVDDVYKYTNKTSGADEGNKQNWGESGVFFKDVTNPTALTGQESVGQFFKDGYKWIKVSINCGQMSSFSIKVLGQEGLENYLVDKIRLNEVFENKDIMYVTDINGNRVDMIKSDTWYNLYIPVKYSENYANWTDVLIYTNGGSVTNPSIMYLKDSQYLFENEASLPDYPIIKDVNIFIRDDMKDNVSIAEDENGVYTYTNKTSGTMEGNNQNWGESGIYFAEIRDGKFFTDGYNYIKADVNFADSISYFTLRFGQNPTNSYWIEKIEFNTALPIGRGLYFFDSNKVKVDSISHNTWYTMFIPVTDRKSVV